jgi:NADH:ubiquinone oxidoreductase subunit H
LTVERRLLAVWQERYGPNRVGPFAAVVADAVVTSRKTGSRRSPTSLS